MLEQGLNIENALRACGSWGWFQKLLCIQSFLYTIPIALNLLHFSFTQYEPNHHCIIPEIYNLSNKNASEKEALLDLLLPKLYDQNGVASQSQCEMFDYRYNDISIMNETLELNQINSTATTGCQYGVVFEVEENSTTVPVEFSLVCESDWKPRLAVSIFFVGILAGSLMTSAADRFGRKPTFLFSCVMQVLAMFGGALSWNFTVYCFFGFINGVSNVVSYVALFIIATEATDTKRRNTLAIISSYSYGISYCVLALIGYYVRHWRWLLGSIALSNFVICAPAIWILPESPRWLIKKGRYDEGLLVLKKIASLNGRKEKFTCLIQTGRIINSETESPSEGIIATIKKLFHSGITARFLACVGGWFAVNLIYFSVAIYSSDFSENMYLNMTLSGLAEIPGCAVIHVAIKKMGRPRTLLLFHTVASITSFTLPFVPEDQYSFITCIAIIGKASISAAFYGWYLVSSEVLPTLQRGSGLSICSAIARIASFASPFLMYTRKFSYFAPNVVMGLVAALSGLSTIIFIPETKGVALPDTVEEAAGNMRFYRWNICQRLYVQDNKDNTEIIREAQDDEIRL